MWLRVPPWAMCALLAAAAGLFALAFLVAMWAG